MNEMTIKLIAATVEVPLQPVTGLQRSHSTFYYLLSSKDVWLQKQKFEQCKREWELKRALGS